MDAGGEVMRVKLEIDDRSNGQDQKAKQQNSGNERRYDPKQRRKQEAEGDRAEELRKQRMRSRGKGRVGTRERASDEGFINRRTKPLQELRDKYAKKIRDLRQQTRVHGPWKPGQKEALSESLKRTREEATRRIDAAEKIERAGRTSRLANARMLAKGGKGANMVGKAARAGSMVSRLASSGIGNMLRAGLGAAARIAGPVAAGYLAARTAANAAPGVGAFLGGEELGQWLQGPAREIASLEGGITSYFDSFEKAGELREAALLLGGDLGGNAYSMPLRSELASIGRKQKEWEAYLGRQKSIRVNAAAGDLFRNQLFGDKSLIASITGQRRHQ